MRFVQPLVALVGLVLTPVLPAVAQTYTVIDLGTLGGDSSEAAAINSRGEVVGWSKNGAGQTRAFMYRAGAMADLGTLVGGTYSYATAINDRGQVIGYGGINADGPQFAERMSSFLWENGSMRPLSGFDERHLTTAAYGINGATGVAGAAATVSGVVQAYRWEGDVVTDVGLSPSNSSRSSSYGINDRGQIVGERDGRAFFWQNGQTLDLGTLPGDSSSRARAINVSDQIIGESTAANGTSRAFIWQGGAMVDLGTLPGDAASRASGINASGHVVGQSMAADGASRAVVWRNGSMSDLNTRVPTGAGWMLTTATAINDAGQISGTGLHDRRTRAFLLTPIKRAPTAPTSVILGPPTR